MRIGTLVLFLLVVVGVAGIALTRQASVPAPQDEHWPEYSAAAADRVILEGPDNVFELVRGKDAWRIKLSDKAVEPLADTRKVEALLEFLALNKPIRRLMVSVGPKEGFVPVAAVCVQGRPRLEVGSEDGSGVGVYARMGDMPGLLVLTREYLDVLTRSPLAYLDTRQVEMDPAKVRNVRLSSMQEGWQVRRNGERGWVFVRPENMKGAEVRTEAMNIWLHEVASLTGSELAETPPEPGRLPDLALSLTDANNRETWLKLWRPLDDSDTWTVLSSRQEVFFLLDQERVQKLQKNAFSLVDRRLVSLDLGRVRRLSLFGDGREFHARRDGESWLNQQAGELTGIDMRLWRLTDVQYEYGPVGALPATAAEALRLVLHDGGDEPLLDLVFYTDPELPGGQCWAGRRGEEAYHPVNARVYMDFQGLLPAVPE